MAQSLDLASSANALDQDYNSTTANVYSVNDDAHCVSTIELCMFGTRLPTFVITGSQISQSYSAFAQHVDLSTNTRFMTHTEFAYGIRKVAIQQSLRKAR